MRTVDCRDENIEEELVYQWGKNNVAFISSGVLVIRDSYGDQVDVCKKEIPALLKAISLAEKTM